MTIVQYPFIDIAVHERVRERFAAGEAIVVFSPDMGHPVWANGRGAGLFGFDSIYDFLERGPSSNDTAFRQIKAAASQLTSAGDRCSVVVRVASGFQRLPIQAVCELIQVQGETALLFSAPMETGSLSASARAARMIEGLDDPDTHMAVLDGTGEVLASSSDYGSLGISGETARMLVSMAGTEPSRLSKRPIPTSKGYLPAAIGKLSDDPALHLMFTVEAAPVSAASDTVDPQREPAPTGAAGAPAMYHRDDVDALEEQTPAIVDEMIGELIVEPQPGTYEDALRAVSEIVDMEQPDEDVAITSESLTGTAEHIVGAGDSSEGGTHIQPSAGEPPANETTGDGLPDPAGPKPQLPSAPDETNADSFVFRPDGRAVRFVWKIDSAGRFSEVSAEFADAVGPRAADINGMAFGDLAALFHLDPDGKIAELLKKRDTWSGKTIWWPVEGTSLVVPVDLAALPTYTRTREFDGFRGFGIVRISDAVEDPNGVGLTLIPTIVEADAPAPLALEPESTGTETPSTTSEDVTSAADADNEGATAPDTEISSASAPAAMMDPAPSEENGQQEATPTSLSADPQDALVSGRQIPSMLDWPESERPALRIVEKPGRRESDESDKIIHLEGRRSSSGNGLTPVEQAAFREIARQLDDFVGGRQEQPSRAAHGPDRTAADADLRPSAEDASTEGERTDQQGASKKDDAPTEALSRDTAPTATSAGDNQIAEDNEAAGEENAEGVAAVTSADGPDDAPEQHRILEAEEQQGRFSDELRDQMMPARERIGLSADILDQMPVALLVHSGDLLIHANPEFLRLTGYASLEELVAVGGLDALLQRQDLEGKTAEAGGMLLVRADDAILPVTARLQSVRWGNSTELMLALMPVAPESSVAPPSEQPAEIISLPTRGPAHELAQLKVEVEELSAILETATDGVVIIGADGTIRSVNRAASALFNYDNEEINGKPFVTLFAHESQRAVVDYLSGLSGHGVASVLNDGREVIGREASGGFVPIFMTIGKLTSSNGYCAVIRDITQWKRTEEELRTAKRAAETANAHKSDFLAHVSHEIRTPLNAIIGFADMMATERFGPVGHPRYVEYANDIGRSGRHVLDIVNDLLDISKIEAGEMDLDFVAVGLNETVSEAVSLVQPQANNQRVIIRTALSHAVPLVVADHRSVKQIVLNILSNAIRFTPAGGQIVVSTAYETNGNVVLRIRDTGIGMTRSELELAMKPFRQVAGHARKRGDGTGLGLPLTKAMVEANRAAFSINSTPNEGTLVEVTFPSPRVLAT